MVQEKSQILDLIDRSNNILITTKDHPGYDEVASALAWFLFLTSLQKLPSVSLNISNVNRYKFLPQSGIIKSEIRAFSDFLIRLNVDKTKVRELSYDLKGNVLEIKILPEGGNFTPKDVSFADSTFAFDLVIILGAADLDAVGGFFSNNRDLFFNTPIINIDRQTLNTRFAQINAIDLTATSLAEMSYSIMHDSLTKDIATCLLTGMIAKTNSFQSPQVTPETLKLASDLIVAGAEREDIVSHLYRTKDMDRLKIWGRILTRLRQVDKKLVYSYLTIDDTEDKEVDFLGLVDDLVLASPEADLILFFRELKDTQTHVYMYARENYDLKFLLQAYAPKGDRRQVSIVLDKAREETQELLIKYIKDRLKLINQ